MRTRWKSLLPIVALAFVYLGYVIYPIVETLKESVKSDGGITLAHYVAIVTQSANLEAVINSVVVSLLSVLFSLIIGVLFAFVFTQCEFPLRAVLSRLAVLPIALPPLVGVISFLFVFGESGFLPRGIHHVLGVEASTLSLDGIAAIVAVHAYSFYVYFYLFVSNALRTIDASQLEASQALGSSAWRTFRRIILPELKPALLGASILTFMASMASFSAPLLFGGEKRFMTVQIYNAKLNGDLSVAAAQAIGLTIISIAFFVMLKMIVPRDASARKSKGVTRTGTLGLSRTVQRWLIAGMGLLLCIELLPIIAIIVISFAQEGSWTWQLLPDTYTLQNYVKLFSEPAVFDPIGSSVLMSIVAVAASVVVGVSVSYLITKGELRRARFSADVLATLPYAIPGTVVAIGLILAFNKPSIFAGYQLLVGTFWILPLAYFIRLFPLIVRSTSASLESLDDSLLEAGQTFGARGVRIFGKITLPIIFPGIISGALLVMITALGEFVSSILLYTYSNRPISVEILAQMRGYNFGGAAAYSVLLLLVIMSIASVASRLNRSAIDANGVNI